MQTLQTLDLVTSIDALNTQAKPQSLIEYFFWQTYQDCARNQSDARHTSVNDLVLLVKCEPAPVAQVLYRLAYAIFTYAVTNEKDYLQQTVEECYTELENLQAEYSIAQINKYLNKYMSAQSGLVS